jgi:predicted nucleic acid-binding protein
VEGGSPLREIVIDASVVLKWFVKAEENTDIALKIRQSHVEGKIALFAPSLLPYEVTNVLRYNPDFNEEAVEEAIESLFLLNIRWCDATEENLKEAVALAFKNNITVYDASYVSMAKARNTKLLTADKQLKERMPDDETLIPLDSGLSLLD